MIGFGIQPLGTSPVGTGAPEMPPPQPMPGSGAPDLSTGNYRVSSLTGDVARTTAASHRVWNLLATRLESAAVDQTMGIVWPKKIPAGYAFEHRAAIETALYPAVKDGTISLDDVVFERSSDSRGRLAIWVKFTDLTTNLADKMKIYASG
jgi:hypothetical protein